MSICVYGRIKRKCMDEDLLERFLADYYSSGSDIIKEKINSDILITSDVHNDICLLQDKEIIWSQELSHDYSQVI